MLAPLLSSASLWTFTHQPFLLLPSQGHKCPSSRPRLTSPASAVGSRFFQLLQTLLHQASSLLCIFNLSLCLSLSLSLCVSLRCVLATSSQPTNMFRSPSSPFIQKSLSTASPTSFSHYTISLPSLCLPYSSLLLPLQSGFLPICLKQLFPKASATPSQIYQPQAPSFRGTAKFDPVDNLPSS